MPATMKRWLDSLGEDGSTFHPKNPEEFKKATAAMVCSIVNFAEVEKRDELCKFCDIFKAEFHIDEEAAEKLFEDSNYIEVNLAKYAKIIKTGYSLYYPNSLLLIPHTDPILNSTHT